jgi:hypothetical protein
MYFGLIRVYGQVKELAEGLEETGALKRVRGFNKHGRLSYIGHGTGLPTWK